ncbi:MAG: SMC-Scp complex subunit ScpB [Chloroflexota bacterium]
MPLIEQYALERDDHSTDLQLRTVQEPWPFPPHARVVPSVVAALDLAEAADVRLAELGAGQLDELARLVVADWRQRPPRRRPVRPIVPTGPLAHTQRPRHPSTDLIWDDRAEQDANQLVALLFVAATSLRRAEIAETLRISQGRLSRACSVLHADPPRGLRLLDAGDELGLVSAPDCAAAVERHLGQPKPEPLSQAALDTLAIVAYEQPVTRADIRTIRIVDSDAVIETLRARGLVAEDPRFGGRGRPGFLITTSSFLRYFGLSSLSDLPPRTIATAN